MRYVLCHESSNRVIMYSLKGCRMTYTVVLHRYTIHTLLCCLSLIFLSPAPVPTWILIFRRTFLYPLFVVLKYPLKLDQGWVDFRARYLNSLAGMSVYLGSRASTPMLDSQPVKVGDDK